MSAFRVGPAAAWRRTLYAVGVGELLAIAGFSTSSPIMPFYLQDLGVTDPRALALLTGLNQALPAISLAILAPIWGNIADNYGRKPMLLRAMLGGAVVVFLQGLVRAPWQFLVLRILQGCITGTVAAATILVASLAPQEEAGFGLGLLQMAIFLGASLGPLFGGVISDLVGRRFNFFATSVLLLIAGAVVYRFAVDDFKPPESRKSVWKTLVPNFRPLGASKALWVLLAVVAADQLAGTVLTPFLPLFIRSISPTDVLVGSTTGAVLGAGALASALAAVSVGRVSYRLGYKRVLVLCMGGAAALTIPQAFVHTPLQLLGLRIASCFFVGGNMPSVNAMIAERTGRGQRGSVYGLSSSIAAISGALGPAIGASLAIAAGYGSVFLATSVILAVAGLGILLLVTGAQRQPSGRGS
jgi:DHA1 family multidrug resistance protein-like MFS transporter